MIFFEKKWIILLLGRRYLTFSPLLPPWLGLGPGHILHAGFDLHWLQHSGAEHIILVYDLRTWVRARAHTFVCILLLYVFA